MKNIEIFAKTVYVLVGLAALWAFWFEFSDWSTFKSKMDFMSIIAYNLLAIGGANWLVKALFDKDLFELLD